MSTIVHITAIIINYNNDDKKNCHLEETKKKILQGTLNSNIVFLLIRNFYLK